MSTVHWVGGEKGGVGKSVVARVLAQHFVDRKLPFAALDADATHGALLRYYQQYTQAVDLESFISTDQIMDRAFGADRRVLVDLPAQSARLLKRWMDAGDVVHFAQEMDVQMVFWHVTDGGFDSVRELERLVSTFGATLGYVVVKNFGRSSDFRQLDESAGLAALQQMGGRVLELPALDAGTMYEIDRFGSSFWAAANSESEQFALTPSARRRTRTWLAQTYAALGPLNDWL